MYYSLGVGAGHIGSGAEPTQRKDFCAIGQGCHGLAFSPGT